MVICQPWNLIPERCNQHSQNCARYWTAIYAVSFGSKTFFFAAFVQVVGHPELERVSNWRTAARSRHGTRHNSDSVAGWRRVICIAFLPWDELDFEHYTMMWRSERPTTAIHKPNLDVVVGRWEIVNVSSSRSSYYSPDQSRFFYSQCFFSSSLSRLPLSFSSQSRKAIVIILYCSSFCFVMRCDHKKITASAPRPKGLHAWP